MGAQKRSLDEMPTTTPAEEMIAKATAEAQEEQEKVRGRGTDHSSIEKEADFYRNIGVTPRIKEVSVHRINMAFTEENYKFIKAGSMLYGRNMTRFVNDIITRFIAEHPEVKARSEEWYNLIHREDEE